MKVLILKKINLYENMGIFNNCNKLMSIKYLKKTKDRELNFGCINICWSKQAIFNF